ncbi:MAG: hypothetical protein DMG97_22270 [Acidobacteria bacterium]|nr:MAG: hypothetical protein DMG96_35025 [Acidobacteriota bacterium]PYV69289.1 MAG: hypothetical protein DMG97_22270 [Acidobacteriota bacterium]
MFTCTWVKAFPVWVAFGALHSHISARSPEAPKHADKTFGCYKYFPRDLSTTPLPRKVRFAGKIGMSKFLVTPMRRAPQISQRKLSGNLLTKEPFSNGAIV